MITVLGSTGFIGSSLVQFLRDERIDFYAPAREHEFVKGEDLGDVIYCIGLTADFRSKPLATVDAHVCKLNHLLDLNNFDSLLYLSSTRVYQHSEYAREQESLKVNPNNFNDLYNISKLMGESVCLSVNNPKVRIARLSNVVGIDTDSDNFISALLKEGLSTGEINLNSGLKSSKDYVMIDDVVRILTSIVQKGKERLYNVASGTNLSNFEITGLLASHLRCTVKVAPEAKDIIFPEINIDKIKSEFGYSPQSILQRLPGIIDKFKAIK